MTSRPTRAFAASGPFDDARQGGQRRDRVCSGEDRDEAPLHIARLTQRAIVLTPKAVRLRHFARVA